MSVVDGCCTSLPPNSLGWFIKSWSEDCISIEIRHKILLKIATYFEGKDTRYYYIIKISVDMAVARIPCQKIEKVEFLPLEGTWCDPLPKTYCNVCVTLEGVSYQHTGSIPHTIIDMPGVSVYVHIDF